MDFASEQSALIEGLLRGFYRHVWPQLLRDYPNILYIEEEMTYAHDGLLFMSRPDLVVSTGEGDLVYIEYKSTSSKKEGWVNSWATAVQLHSTVRAIKATKGLDVAQVVVQGLYKGFESYGKQSSPFCYAYHRNGNPPFSQSDTLYEYKPGYKRTPVWEMPGGVKAWVAGMPDQVLADQFPQVPPIFVNHDLLTAFFQQRAYREHEIVLANQMLKGADDEAVTNLLNVAYPQRFDQCHPYFGRACSYLRLCHGHVEEPLRSGFERRVPHHQEEVERFEQSGDVVP